MIKQVIVVRTDINMGKGKIAAQAAHAAISAYEKAKQKHPEWVKEWLPFQKKVVVKIDSFEKIVNLFEQVKKELPAALIRDAGLTQIPSGTVTALGIGPAPEELIDKYTKDLKLL